MARLGRPGGLSAAGKKELWKRWRAGEAISDIARALQKPPPAPFTGCSRPPEGSLRPSGVGADARSPRASGRRSPGDSLPENPFVRSPLGWAALCFHRVPGGEPQRRSQELPGSEGAREGVGESPPSQQMPACNKPLLARCASTEATRRLLARADLRLAEKRVS